MLNMVLLAIIVLLLIICLILLILLVKRNSVSSKKTTVKSKVEKNIDISELEFPKKIEEMGHHLLTQSCIKVFDSFKALDYANKSEKVLHNLEWHSWQVSLLLTLIQQDKEFFIPNSKSIIHKAITSKPLNTIDNYMQKIITKYFNSVNVNNTRDELSKDLIWSVKEVSIIFYYMANLKKNK